MVDDNRRDQGQSALLVMFVTVAVLALLLVAMTAYGGRLADRARAQSAADAAALALVLEGPSMAAELVSAHGATMVSSSFDGETAIVTVRVGTSTATASATDAP